MKNGELVLACFHSFFNCNGFVCQPNTVVIQACKDVKFQRKKAIYYAMLQAILSFDWRLLRSLNLCHF